MIKLILTLQRSYMRSSLNTREWIIALNLEFDLFYFLRKDSRNVGMQELQLLCITDISCIFHDTVQFYLN